MLGGGAAWAAIPDTSTARITACYPTSGTSKGSLRVIDTGQSCRSGERAVSWQSRGLRYRGAWSSTASYSRDDVVTSGGSTYVAKATSKGVSVTNTTSWALLVQRGATGPAGAAGPTGPPGPTGPTGASGANSELRSWAFAGTVSGLDLLSSSSGVANGQTVAPTSATATITALNPLCTQGYFVRVRGASSGAGGIFWDLYFDAEGALVSSSAGSATTNTSGVSRALSITADCMAGGFPSFETLSAEFGVSGTFGFTLTTPPIAWS